MWCAHVEICGSGRVGTYSISSYFHSYLCRRGWLKVGESEWRRVDIHLPILAEFTWNYPLRFYDSNGTLATVINHDAKTDGKIPLYPDFMQIFRESSPILKPLWPSRNSSKLFAIIYASLRVLLICVPDKQPLSQFLMKSSSPTCLGPKLNKIKTFILNWRPLFILWCLKVQWKN